MEKFDIGKAKVGCGVVTRSGVPVRMLDFEYRNGEGEFLVGKILDGEERIVVFRMDGRAHFGNPEDDLFLSDDDPFWDEMGKLCSESLGKEAHELYASRELTAFEKAVRDVIWAAYNYDDLNTDWRVRANDPSNVIPTAASLLRIAKSEISGERKHMNVREYAEWLLGTFPHEAVVMNDGALYSSGSNTLIAGG